MAITTTNEKLSLLDIDEFEAALPISPGTFDEREKWHLIHGFYVTSAPAPSGLVVPLIKSSNLGKSLLKTGNL